MENTIIQMENDSQLYSDQELLARYGQLQHAYEMKGGYTWRGEVHKLLADFGFGGEKMHHRVENLSGGEKNRLMLVITLLRQSDLLLLDEPTNHLDIITCEKLEETLSHYRGSVLIVSHDRYFLDRCVDKIFYQAAGKLQTYYGNYSHYLQECQKRTDQTEKTIRMQQEEIQRTEDYIQRNIYGQKTKQAKSRRKKLEKIKANIIERPQEDQRLTQINILKTGRGDHLVLEARDIAKAFEDNNLFNPSSFTIYRGEKIGLMGPNGSGKTSLLRCLLGEITPDQGEIQRGNRTSWAYYDQNMSIIDPSKRAIDEIWDLDQTISELEVRNYMAGFLFREEDVFKSVKDFSGGEQARLALAKLFYHPCHFLVLDEPTNHLDIQSREVLEDALQKYNGAVLVVSHDRYFLDRVINRILYLDQGCLDEYLGNYTYFKEKQEQIRKKTPEGLLVNPQEEATHSDHAYLDGEKEKKGKSSHHKGKQKRSLRKRLEKLKQETIVQEEELEEVSQKMSQPESQQDWQLLHQLQERKDELEEMILSGIEESEQIEEQLEEME